MLNFTLIYIATLVLINSAISHTPVVKLSKKSREWEHELNWAVQHLKKKGFSSALYKLALAVLVDYFVGVHPSDVGELWFATEEYTGEAQHVGRKHGALTLTRFSIELIENSIGLVRVVHFTETSPWVVSRLGDDAEGGLGGRTAAGRAACELHARELGLHTTDTRKACAVYTGQPVNADSEPGDYGLEQQGQSVMICYRGGRLISMEIQDAKESQEWNEDGRVVGSRPGES
ncbi:hypothetical protein RHMOL_Rhmol01G0244100 [Rhododendron molle]|uniref:Uncharacterized protein n=1 Tax=Rhododendron molle TaxID=49168 RepID=A0ACC0Q6B5_RHOML|nr:hypothetical protein RHMOL_Rhmol01G0244100 [Rhododendron molle]